MKKHLGIGIAILTVMFLLTSASRPSIDGRAVVADDGVLPVGMFAKSVGYLPGDSVVITNPATGMSVDVMILGSISSSEGVAVMLSPEAATKLFITKGANVQVKVTKKTSSPDENSIGSILPVTGVKTKNADPDKNPEEALPDSLKDNIASQSIILEKQNPVAEETVSPVHPASDVVAETVSPVHPASDVVAETVSPVHPASDVVTETPSPVNNQDNSVAESPSTKPLNEVLVVETEKYFMESEVASTKDAPVIAELNEPILEDEHVTEETLLTDSPLEPIVLVPVSDNPPPVKILEEIPVVESIAEVSSNTEHDMPPVVQDEIDVVMVPEVAPIAVESEELEPIILQPVADLVSPENDIFSEPEVISFSENVNSVLNSTSELEKNAFYIQIAVYKEKDNIKKLEDKYGEKYPLSFVETADERIQAFIGPLSVDEYETVLLRFRKNGFKDAFIRKF